jgi:hypothetical protein
MPCLLGLFIISNIGLFNIVIKAKVKYIFILIFCYYYNIYIVVYYL